jgi:hypothetical protein
VFKVGCELAAACQPFGMLDAIKNFPLKNFSAKLFFTVSQHLTDSSLSLPEMISTSQTTKARLLHYFPPSEENALPSDDEPVDSWCGFHLDHSLLTGLCSVSLLSSSQYHHFDSGQLLGYVPSQRGRLFTDNRFIT